MAARWCNGEKKRRNASSSMSFEVHLPFIPPTSYANPFQAFALSKTKLIGLPLSNANSSIPCPTSFVDSNLDFAICTPYISSVQFK